MLLFGHQALLQRMPADVGIWDLAVSINNQRLLSEDDSGNKQKEASLIFIGEKEPHCTVDCVKKKHFFNKNVTQAARVWARQH